MLNFGLEKRIQQVKEKGERGAGKGEGGKGAWHGGGEEEGRKGGRVGKGKEGTGGKLGNIERYVLHIRKGRKRKVGDGGIISYLWEVDVRSWTLLS